MHIGNHCVLFGPRIVDETETILQGFANAGAEGVEIGQRFFGDDRREELFGLLEKYNLKLAAFHVSCYFPDPLDSFETVRTNVLKAVRFLQGSPVRNIMLTCMANADSKTDFGPSTWDKRATDHAAHREMAAALDSIASEALSLGVQVNYHNHLWEFNDDAHLYSTLAEETKFLKLGMDTGWAAVAGNDSPSLIRKYKDKIGYLHLRDFCRARLPQLHGFEEICQNVYVELGQGDVGFPRVLEAAQEVLGADGWATVEHEVGEQTFDRYIRANAYIRSLMKK